MIGKSPEGISFCHDYNIKIVIKALTTGVDGDIIKTCGGKRAVIQI
jgi:hypothetical protein